MQVTGHLDASFVVAPSLRPLFAAGDRARRVSETPVSVPPVQRGLRRRSAWAWLPGSRRTTPVLPRSRGR